MGDHLKLDLSLESLQSQTSLWKTPGALNQRLLFCYKSRRMISDSSGSRKSAAAAAASALAAILYVVFNPSPSGKTTACNGLTDTFRAVGNGNGESMTDVCFYMPWSKLGAPLLDTPGTDNTRMHQNNEDIAQNTA